MAFVTTLSIWNDQIILSLASINGFILFIILSLQFYKSRRPKETTSITDTKIMQNFALFTIFTSAFFCAAIMIYRIQYHRLFNTFIHGSNHLGCIQSLDISLFSCKVCQLYCSLIWSLSTWSQLYALLITTCKCIIKPF